MKNNAKPIKITLEMENKMRLLANLIIDRVFEDYKNNTLRLKSNSNGQETINNTRVKRKGNTT